MKTLLILSLALAILAGCAGADYGHTASSSEVTFKMVKPKPVNGNFRGDSAHRLRSGALAANSIQ
jgi:hypothetical protein